MTLGEAIIYEKHVIKKMEEEALEARLQCKYEKIKSYLTFADEHRRILKWLMQLQEIKKTIREYRNVPMEVMDSDDALAKICEVVGE
jgi:transposase